MIQRVNKGLIALMAAMFLATLLLSGCGQKGPLYLPDHQKQEKKKNQ
jgi:predicted small lipoprotein YifL